MVCSTRSRGLFENGSSLIVLVKAKRAQGNLQETLLPIVVGRHEKHKTWLQMGGFYHQFGQDYPQKVMLVLSPMIAWSAMPCFYQ